MTETCWWRRQVLKSPETLYCKKCTTTATHKPRHQVHFFYLYTTSVNQNNFPGKTWQGSNDRDSPQKRRETWKSNCLSSRITANYIFRRMQITFLAPNKSPQVLTTIITRKPMFFKNCFLHSLNKFDELSIQTAVIVMGITSYNSVTVNKAPASNSKKADTVAWLSGKKSQTAAELPAFMRKLCSMNFMLQLTLTVILLWDSRQITANITPWNWYGIR
jgi:hypothetical protein